MHCVQWQILAPMYLGNKLESHQDKAPKGSYHREVKAEGTSLIGTNARCWGCKPSDRITLPFFVSLLKSIILDPIEGRLTKIKQAAVYGCRRKTEDRELRRPRSKSDS